MLTFKQSSLIITNPDAYFTLHLLSGLCLPCFFEFYHQSIPKPWPWDYAPAPDSCKTTSCFISGSSVNEVNEEYKVLGVAATGMTRAEYSLSGYLNLCDNVWWKHFCPSICCQSYLCKSRGHCLGLSVLHISIEYRWSEFITKWFLFADRPHAWLLGLQSTNQIHLNSEGMNSQRMQFQIYVSLSKSMCFTISISL